MLPTCQVLDARTYVGPTYDQHTVAVSAKLLNILAQVVRSLRIVRFVAALRALVLSVVDTTRQLVWALILLLLVIYSFGILFTDAVLEYLFAGASEGEDTTDLMKYFGTVFSSCSTLFRSILGGTDWDSAVDALVPVGMAWVLLFHIYIAFCGFWDTKWKHIFCVWRRSKPIIYKLIYTLDLRVPYCLHRICNLYTSRDIWVLPVGFSPKDSFLVAFGWVFCGFSKTCLSDIESHSTFSRFGFGV